MTQAPVSTNPPHEPFSFSVAKEEPLSDRLRCADDLLFTLAQDILHSTEISTGIPDELRKIKDLIIEAENSLRSTAETLRITTLNLSEIIPHIENKTVSVVINRVITNQQKALATLQKGGTL